MKTLKASLVVLWIGMMGCGEQEAVDDAIAPAECEEARTHLQACFPEREAQVPKGCTADSAAAISGKTCAQLEGDVSSDSKSDSACNPWYWWLCDKSGGSSSKGYSFQLDISVCESELCVETLFGTNRSGAECGKITLENELGEVVATDYINDYLATGGVQDTGEGFKNLDLPAGEYTAKLWRRNGQQALTTKQELAQIAVTLGTDGTVERDAANFEILKTEADAIKACTTVSGSLRSTCEMSDEETEWGWMVRLEGTHSEGRYEDIRRSAKYYMRPAHAFAFRRVRPGDYTITYIEMDVPSWSRELNMDFEEYEELVRRYATGNQIVERLEVTLDEVASETLELEVKALEQMECR